MSRVPYHSVRDLSRNLAIVGLTAVTSARRHFCVAVIPGVITILSLSSTAHADWQVSGGSATFTIIEGKAAAISEFDAYFNASATRAQTLADPAPGNAPFTETATSVTLVDPIRPFGVPVAPGTPGVTRSPQATTLQIGDLGNVLGSWSTSNDSFAFVGNSTLGEQIALTNMQRWTGPFTGSLLYGDFALRNTGSKLVLTSNIDFLNAAFADIGNPNISVSGNILTIQGDLLVGGGLFVLDSSAIPGTDFGDVTITATLSNVPEPSSLVLAGFGIVSVAVLRCRRERRPGS